VYFTCIFGSAFLSAVAALVLKLELLKKWPRHQNDLAATAATFAALLITLSTVGDFQRKWQANRVAAGAMENLAYEMLKVKTPSGLEEIVIEIQTINDARSRGIVGDLSTGQMTNSNSASDSAQPAPASNGPAAGEAQ
jgi:hypothetical protein